MVTPYESYVAVCEALNELTPGRPRQALGAVQLRGRGRGERGEDRPRLHPPPGDRRVRARLPRPHQPDDGPDRQEHALQALVRPVRPRDLPRAAELPVPRRPDRGRGRCPRASAGSTRRSARTTSPRSSSSRSPARAGSSSRPRASCPSWSSSPAPTAIVFVADEIQTGFCRTGDWFACDHEAVVPDLITTAKGIAGGLPLAAVTGRAEIMDAVHVGGLGGTYGGNPVACAAALGSIEEMREGDLNAAARRIGELMVPRLEALAERTGRIGDVRGRGAMIAVEIVVPGTDRGRPRLDLRGREGLPRRRRGGADRRDLRQRAALPAAAEHARAPAGRGADRHRAGVRQPRLNPASTRQARADAGQVRSPLCESGRPTRGLPPRTVGAWKSWAGPRGFSRPATSSACSTVTPAPTSTSRSARGSAPSARTTRWSRGRDSRRRYFDGPGAARSTAYVDGRCRRSPGLHLAVRRRRHADAVPRRARRAAAAASPSPASAPSRCCPRTPHRSAWIALRAMGFTAVSIGAQSFHDEVLHRLRRPHDARTARAAVRRRRGPVRPAWTWTSSSTWSSTTSSGRGLPARPHRLLRAGRRPGLDLSADAVRVHPVRDHPPRPPPGARGPGRGHRGSPPTTDTSGARCGPSTGGARRPTRRSPVGASSAWVRGRRRSSGRTSSSTTSGSRPTPTRWTRDGSPSPAGCTSARSAAPPTTRSGRPTPDGSRPAALARGPSRSDPRPRRSPWLPSSPPGSCAGSAPGTTAGYALTPRGFDRYHDLERTVTYRLIEPLWGQMLEEHAREGASATWATPCPTSGQRRLVGRQPGVRAPGRRLSRVGARRYRWSPRYSRRPYVRTASITTRGSPANTWDSSPAKRNPHCWHRPSTSMQRPHVHCWPSSTIDALVAGRGRGAIGDARQGAGEVQHRVARADQPGDPVAGIVTLRHRQRQVLGARVGRVQVVRHRANVSAGPDASAATCSMSSRLIRLTAM